MITILKYVYISAILASHFVISEDLKNIKIANIKKNSQLCN